MNGLTKKIILLVVAAALVVAGIFVPIDGLSHEGTISLFIMLAGVVLWVGGVMPLAVTGFLLMLLLIVLNVATANDVVAGFMNATMLFILFVFSFGTVLKKTPFSQKLVGVVLKISKGNSSLICLGYLLVGCVMSMFMANLAVVAILLPIGVSILEALGQPKLKSHMGKIMLMGLPIAAMVGGAGTPIGHPMNALCNSMLEQITGISVNFGIWCLVGIPVAIVVMILTFLILKLMFKPEPISEEQFKALVEKFNDIPPATAKDKFALVSLVVLVVMLIAGTWIPLLSVLNVGLLGIIWFMFPGVEILTWDEFVGGIAWDVFFMFGSVSAVIQVMLKTGAADWLANALVSLVSGPGFVIALALTVIACIIVVFFPVGPSLLPVMFSPFLGLIAASGMPEACIPILLAFTLGSGFVLAINPPMLISMGSGYWKSNELVVPGIATTVMFAIVVGLGVPGILLLVGA
ncbi:SLC13 family permease [Adlercreutzia sp. ZJ473]|uniref:SLC13 family permease n=1 Tax=Adlercreutzia sp. ZJ473 TaxID=2722822 RepID=UPI001557DD8B|nr:SLC13 family permease [Adlercreutzia sp. ZJ473]